MQLCVVVDNIHEIVEVLAAKVREVHFALLVVNRGEGDNACRSRTLHQVWSESGKGKEAERKMLFILNIYIRMTRESQLISTIKLL